MNKLLSRAICLLPVVAVVATAGCLSTGSGTAERMKPSVKSFEAQGYRLYTSSGYEMIWQSNEINFYFTLQMGRIAKIFKEYEDVYTYTTNRIALMHGTYQAHISKQERFIRILRRLSCDLVRYELIRQGESEEGMLVVRDGYVYLKMREVGEEMEFYDRELKKVMNKEGFVHCKEKTVGSSGTGLNGAKISAILGHNHNLALNLNPVFRARDYDYE